MGFPSVSSTHNYYYCIYWQIAIIIIGTIFALRHVRPRAPLKANQFTKR